MPLIIPTGYSQVIFGYTVPGQAGDVVNVFGIENVGDFTDSELVNLLDDSMGVFTNTYSSTVNMNSITVKRGDGTPNPVVFISGASNGGARDPAVFPRTLPRLSSKARTEAGARAVAGCSSRAPLRWT